MSNNIASILVYGKNYLSNYNIKTPLLDVQLILMHVTGKTKVQILTDTEYVLSDLQYSFFLDLLKKRADNMPVKYITGTCEFMNLDFRVNNFVLIPRADTEILVETALDILMDEDNIIMDMCCGCGCIAISIAHYLRKANVIAVDISYNALSVAKENALLNNVSDKISFIRSDLFNSIPNEIKVDAIISNPPYIPDDQIQFLDDDVKEYEPIEALSGGIDGLDFYRDISFHSKKYLKNNGYLLFEIGFDQFEEVEKILINNGYKNVNIILDLAGHNRVVFANLP